MEKPPQKSLYFIALVPGEPLRSRVRRLKQEMASRFGASHALKSPAHITLRMPFRRAEAGEQALIGALQQFTSAGEALTIRLSGFDAFPPRVIFLKVLDHDPLADLHAKLQEHLKITLGFPAPAKALPFHPHMTIATRDLSEASFHRAWPGFSDRPFEAAFRAESLFLLKHNGKAWDLYREFTFSPGADPGERQAPFS